VKKEESGGKREGRKRERQIGNWDPRSFGGSSPALENPIFRFDSKFNTKKYKKIDKILVL
jgi:hypothetical protein